MINSTSEKNAGKYVYTLPPVGFRLSHNHNSLRHPGDSQWSPGSPVILYLALVTASDVFAFGHL